MYIKRFRRGYEAVPDPLHPSRTAQRPVLKAVPSTYPLVYTDGSGKRVEMHPDADGWFDVPEDVGAFQCKFRTPQGEGFYPERDVAEERRLGRTDEPERSAPERPRTRSLRARPED